LSKTEGNGPSPSLTPNENIANISKFYDVEVKEQKLAQEVIQLQLVVLLIFAVITFAVKGTSQFVLAVLSGGGISVINGALLAWRMSRSTLLSVQNANQQLRHMYFYAAERFLVVVLLLGICIATMKSMSLVILGSFVLGQSILLAARLIIKK